MESEKTIEKAQVTAEYLHRRLCEEFLNHKNVGEIRHVGLINAIELVEDKGTKKGFDSELRVGYQIYKRALEYGLVLRPLGNVLYFNPPLIISEAEIDLAIERMKKSCGRYIRILEIPLGVFFL